MNTVVFDMDGVIFDTENCYTICWKEIALKYNLGDMDPVIKKCIGTNEAMTKKIVLDYLGQDFDYDQMMKDMMGLFNERYGKFPPKKEGIDELLQFLKNNNYKVGLASSTRKEIIIQELTNTNLIQYFDEIVGGDMVSKSKPEPDIYLKACQLLQEKPENCYAIEDSYNGIRSSFSANMKPIMIPDLVMPDDEMKEKSYCILDNLFELKNMLEKEKKSLR